MLDDILKAIRGQWQPSMARVIAEKIVIADGGYTADDVVSEGISDAGTAWRFSGMARKNGKGGYITTALVTAETTNIASWLSLFLFTDVPSCELDDEDANTAPLVADRLIYVGRIDFPACSDLGTGMSESLATPSTVGNLPMGFVCEHNSKDLYGVVVIRNTVDLADDTYLTFSLIVEQH